LTAQKLVGTPCADVAGVVRWFGAVQSQDYYGAKWSLALRCGFPTSAEVEAAYDRGEIIRTHAMRPTWHFVAPEDLRWIQRLTGSRVHAANGHMKRKLGIGDAMLKRSRVVLEKLLGGVGEVTREEIGRAFSKAKLPSEGTPLAYLVMDAELDGVICSGPRRGKKFTYALADRRIREHVTLQGDEALAELTWRYIRSHGPASAKDFSWWSGLALTTARRGLEANASRLASHTLDGEMYWTATDFAPVPLRSPRVQIVSIYDELLVAYRDHTHSYEPITRETLAKTRAIVITAVVLNGWVVGLCRKDERRGEIQMDCTLCRALSARELNALEEAAENYGRHLGLPVRLTRSTK
jgi:hypothetical protein